MRVAVALVVALALFGAVSVRAMGIDHEAEAVPGPVNTDGTTVAPVPDNNNTGGSSGAAPATPAAAPAVPAAPSTPTTLPKKHKLRTIKDLKKRFPIEAAYYGEKYPRRPRQYINPEYGDPNPRATEERLRRERKTGREQPKRIFRTSFFGGATDKHPLVKCFGKGKKEKCYAVDKKTGAVIGRDSISRTLPRVVSHSGPMHTMETKGFNPNVEYNERLALWKPRKNKRTLAPAPMLSLAEVDAETEEEDEAEEEEAEEDEEEESEEAEDEAEEEADEEADEEVEEEAEEEAEF